MITLKKIVALFHFSPKKEVAANAECTKLMALKNFLGKSFYKKRGVTKKDETWKRDHRNHQNIPYFC